MSRLPDTNVPFELLRPMPALAAVLAAMFSEDFEGCVLRFDSTAVTAYAVIVNRRRAGTAVATRNTADFVDCGVALIDPWGKS